MTSEKLAKAFEFANSAHQKQKRKGTKIPYISHPMAVASMTLEAGADEEVAIAAILHDVIEDSEGKINSEILEKHFGKNVAQMVSSLSDATTFPKPEWKKRKLKYLSQIEAAADGVKLIAACDKWHNLKSLLRDLDDMGDEVWEKFSAGPEDQLWYYQEVFKRVEESIPLWLAEDLFEAINFLEELIDQE